MRVLLAILLSVFSCSAANWYVDNAAAGSNNGTSWANAWTSFASISWGSMNSGDTLYLSGGSASKTYTGQLSVGKSGITIRPGADSGHTGIVVIDQENSTAVGIRLYGYTVTIDGISNYGIVITNVAASGAGIYDSAGGGGTIRHVRITGNQTSNANDLIGGIYVNGGQTPVVIENCWIGGAYNATPANLWHANGICLFFSGTLSSTTNFIVRNCKVENLYHDGIKTSGHCTIYSNEVAFVNGSAHSDGIVVQSGSSARIFANYIHDGTDQSIYLNNLAADSKTNNWIYNNVIWRTNGIGIIVDNESGGFNGVSIWNNTITASLYPIRILHRGTGSITNVDIRNNYFGATGSEAQVAVTGSTNISALDYNDYATGSAVSPNIAAIGGTSYTLATVRSGLGFETHGSTGNPSFQNVFHLAASDTVLRDKGTDLSLYFTRDKDNGTRTAPWDMGAYEYMVIGISAPVRIKGNAKFK